MDDVLEQQVLGPNGNRIAGPELGTLSSRAAVKRSKPATHPPGTSPFATQKASDRDKKRKMNDEQDRESSDNASSGPFPLRRRQPRKAKSSSSSPARHGEFGFDLSDNQRPSQETGLQAEMAILRTQLRAAKAEAKTYQDENADLNYRIMEAERKAKNAKTDAAAAEAWAKEAEKNLDQISKLKEADKRRWHELEAELKVAEDEAELATKGKEEAEKLVEAYKLVLKNHGLLAGGMVGAASAGRDGASTEVTEPSYGDVEPIIHE